MERSDDISESTEDIAFQQFLPVRFGIGAAMTISPPTSLLSVRNVSEKDSSLACIGTASGFAAFSTSRFFDYVESAANDKVFLEAEAGLLVEISLGDAAVHVVCSPDNCLLAIATTKHIYIYRADSLLSGVCLYSHLFINIVEKRSNEQNCSCGRELSQMEGRQLCNTGGIC